MPRLTIAPQFMHATRIFLTTQTTGLLVASTSVVQTLPAASAALFINHVLITALGHRHLIHFQTLGVIPNMCHRTLCQLSSGSLTSQTSPERSVQQIANIWLALSHTTFAIDSWLSFRISNTCAVFGKAPWLRLRFRLTHSPMPIIQAVSALLVSACRSKMHSIRSRLRITRRPADSIQRFPQAARARHLRERSL